MPVRVVSVATRTRASAFLLLACARCTRERWRESGSHSYSLAMSAVPLFASACGQRERGLKTSHKLAEMKKSNVEIPDTPSKKLNELLQNNVAKEHDKQYVILLSKYVCYIFKVVTYLYHVIDTKIKSPRMSWTVSLGIVNLLLLLKIFLGYKIVLGVIFLIDYFLLVLVFLSSGLAIALCTAGFMYFENASQSETNGHVHQQ